MTVGFKASIGMFLFPGWDGGRKSNFGFYFATLLFVAVLCFIVEAVPYIRGKYFAPTSSKQGKGYAEIQNRSAEHANERHFNPQESSIVESNVSLSWHLLDTCM